MVLDILYVINSGCYMGIFQAPVSFQVPGLLMHFVQRTVFLTPAKTTAVLPYTACV